MSNTFYFSYDEEGFNFFENISDLISSDARMEDCYIYHGNVTEQYIRDDDNNDNETRETCIIEYISKLETATEKLCDCVEDSIANQLDNLNEAGGTDFCEIEELYDAYHQQTKTIEAQDLKIIQMEDKIKEVSEDLHWKNNDLYYANKSKDSNWEWALNLQKQRNEYKEQLEEKQKQIEELEELLRRR